MLDIPHRRTKNAPLWISFLNLNTAKSIATTRDMHNRTTGNKLASAAIWFLPGYEISLHAQCPLCLRYTFD